MVVDSGAEALVVCPADKHFMNQVTKLHLPTAGGDVTLDTIGDPLCGAIVCYGCVFHLLLTVLSLLSTARGEKMDISWRDVLEC